MHELSEKMAVRKKVTSLVSCSDTEMSIALARLLRCRVKSMTGNPTMDAMLEDLMGPREQVSEAQGAAEHHT